jgi:DNA repair exonuclease SbcCD ATPase subunit
MNPIESAAASLAAAEEDLAEAETTYRARADELALITGRLTDATNRRIEIVAEARAKPDDMAVLGKLALVEQDVEDLQHLRDEAERAAEEAKPTKQRADVDRAKQHLEQAKALASFDAVTEHTKACEHALCASLSRLHQLGQVIGKPRELSAVWKPSAPLYNAMQHRVVPQ